MKFNKKNKEEIKKILSIITIIGGFLIMFFGIFNLFITDWTITYNNINFADDIISYQTLNEMQNETIITEGQYFQQIDTSLRLTTLAAMISTQNIFILKFLHLLTILIGIQFIAIGKLLEK